MTSSYEYRLKLATGFLGEARQDMALKRWRSVMDNAQLAVEKAAKAVLAFVGPVGRTHQSGLLLHSANRQTKEKTHEQRYWSCNKISSLLNRSAVAEISRDVTDDLDSGPSTMLPSGRV